jgi:cytidylate kinase
VTVIAIDGPAGSGKSTIAQALADQLRSEVLDTGAMYRAVTFAVLTAGVDPADADAAAAVACRADVVVDGRSVTVDGVDATTAIRGPEVSAAVSIVSAYPPVRAHLREMQRRWMVEHGGGVVEGRDIGTVVFPDAALKVFLIADASVRARRRAGDGQLDETTAAANIEARDRLDSTRADSPLVAAEDAVVLDTSDLTVDEVVARIVAHLAEATR